MTTRVFKAIDKKGRESEWSWEETPEVLAALEKINASPELATPQQEGAKKALKAPNAPSSKGKA
tara:strand:- start:2799 stop:2990 length:192 start_codon:yes stop_codon:yes gene_type:complete